MKKRYILAILFVLLFGSSKALAQDPFIAEIKMFAGNFAPVGWMFCNGQTLSIADNAALFSLIGTIYGGDGITTFNLPDLRGRAPLHTGSGTGPGLSQRFLGEQGGAESVSLTVANLPAHSHALNVSTASGTSSSPAGGFFADSGATDKEYAPASNTTMGLDASEFTGSNFPVYNMKPFLTVNFIIATEGIYPPRN